MINHRATFSLLRFFICCFIRLCVYNRNKLPVPNLNRPIPIIKWQALDAKISVKNVLLRTVKIYMYVIIIHYVLCWAVYSGRIVEACLLQALACTASVALRCVRGESELNIANPQRTWWNIEATGPCLHIHTVSYLQIAAWLACCLHTHI